MEISFSDGKLEKECNDEKLLLRRHGKDRARRIKLRLAVLRNAATLSAIGLPYVGPCHCHELGNDRAGQLSVDLDHPYRLIFIPDHDPVPMLAAGGLDWSKVTAIKIIEIVDTHG